LVALDRDVLDRRVLERLPKRRRRWRAVPYRPADVLQAIRSQAGWVISLQAARSPAAKSGAHWLPARSIFAHLLFSPASTLEADELRL
jgi:hypothetical protein